MAKNGYKIFDSDTHVGPYLDVLDPYLTDAERSRLAAWEAYKSDSKGYGIYVRGQRHYRRRLGAADPRSEGVGMDMAGAVSPIKRRSNDLNGAHE